LSRLRKTDEEYFLRYEIVTFHWNICGNTLPYDCPSANSAYRYLWNCNILGYASTSQWGLINPSIPALGPTLTYSSDSMCGEDTLSITFRFYCNVTQEAQVQRIVNPMNCNSIIEYQTKYGCPISSVNIMELSPPQGSVEGGTKVVIKGTGFVNSGDLSCRFGTVFGTQATFISAEAMSCISPPSPVAGASRVSVSNDGIIFSIQEVYYRYIN